MNTEHRTHRRSFYHRLTIAGALVAAGGAAVYAATAIPAGDPSAPLFVPVTLAILAASFLMRRTRKALWIAAVGGPLVLGVLALDPFRLTHPDSFIDFVPSVLVVAGTATATAAAIATLAQRRRGTDHRATHRDHVLVSLAALTLLAVAAYSGFATLSRPATATLPGGRTAVVLDADEDRCVPSSLSAPAAADMVILVRNPNWIAHTFSAPDLGIEGVYIAPRAERAVEIRTPSAGSYRFACDVTGHEGMAGTLRVA